MPLLGALSNHADKLSRLRNLKRVLMKEAAKRPKPATSVKPRLGEIRDAIIETLEAGAPEAIPIGEILAVAERRLGKRLSRDTVNSCLSVGAKGSHPQFVRVRAGWYRLA